MKAPVMLSALALGAVVFIQSSSSQEPLGSKETLISQVPPFISAAGSVPEGSSITYAAAYPVLGDGVFPIYAHLSIGFSSVLQLSYSNEGVVANALGITNPMDSWRAKLQLTPRREQFPSVAVYFKGTIGWQSQFLGANDFQNQIPRLYNEGLNGTSYEFSSTTAGLGMESQISEALTIRFALGLQEVRSRNLWLFIAPAPIIGNGFHDTGNHNSLILDGSASVSYTVRPKLALLAEVVTLSYYTINVPNDQLELLRAYASALGVRYSLSPILNLDTYIRQQSKINDIAFTQFRMGISGLFSVAE